RFRVNDMFIPEVLMSARAMRFGMEVLRPLLAETGAKPVSSVILGTVAGDLHDIGKDIVHMMLEGAGFQVLNLGINVEASRFVAAYQEHKAPVIALSALLSTTMPQQQAVIEAFQKAGLRDEVKILVGGAPVTQEYADKIGADGYAPDAATAVLSAKELLGIS
ncbi:MAG: cobalamin-dependent protein, partial [Chloroflexi bacterium]|nr:cobalamin-dependent protein [Chloroflexota bacterium]